MGAFVVLFLFWVGVGGVVGHAIGEPRGRGTEGAVLGMLLGVIGWILIAVIEPTAEVRRARQTETMTLAAHTFTPYATGAGRACPWCAETIKPAAIVCRFCGRNVDPVAASATTPPPVTLPDLRAIGIRHVVTWSRGVITIDDLVDPESGRWTFPASSVLFAEILPGTLGVSRLKITAANRPAQSIDFRTDHAPSFEELVARLVPVRGG